MQKVSAVNPGSTRDQSGGNCGKTEFNLGSILVNWGQYGVNLGSTGVNLRSAWGQPAPPNHMIVEGRFLAVLRAPTQALAIEIPQHHSSVVARGDHSAVAHIDPVRQAGGSLRASIRAAIGARLTCSMPAETYRRRAEEGEEIQRRSSACSQQTPHTDARRRGR